MLELERPQMQEAYTQNYSSTTRLTNMILVVHERLKELSQQHSLKPLKDLFWTELSYRRANTDLSTRHWSQTMRDSLQETPIRLATGGEDDDYSIFYFRLKGDRLSLSAERPIVLKLLDEQLDGLFIFSNAAQNRWHFVNVKHDNTKARRRLFRRITVGPEERLRTASERLAGLDLTNKEHASRLEVRQLHEQAFDVEAITDKFFQAYRNLFRILQKDLTLQTGDEEWAHDYALQFLNRCMFIYFLQRKGWLGEDREFLQSFWNSFNKPGPEHKDRAEYQKGAFFEYWLQVLFFEAFNKKFLHSRTYFPQSIFDTLAKAPYLNGGLFARNELDTRYTFAISDSRFQQVFEFLQGYNFTIAEDSPLDQEVAVDPEMIGKVYESLVNVTTEKDERGEAGIFYTPRIEIDLMCRLSLVNYLTNQIGEGYKQVLYDVVFAIEPHEKSEADDRAAAHGLWSRLFHNLRSMRAVDPACGSGSFLVGMLAVLDDLQRRANERSFEDENAYRRKKRIIEQNLYGVDVMDWAAHVAELRLWLTLIVEDIPDDPSISTIEGRYSRIDPLLPHLSFKVRPGDSLVQEVGGLSMGLNITKNLPRDLLTRLNTLKSDKSDYFHNYASRHPKTKEQLVQEEFSLFCAILDAQIHAHQETIKKYNRVIEIHEGERSLLDEQPLNTLKARQEIEKHRQLIATEEAELARLREARLKLKTPKDEPFVWDIAFPEVFEEDDRRGFDIVIGNPPYVRQEQIMNPHLSREVAMTEQNKQAYKAQLARAVYQAYPAFFEYQGGSAGRKLDAKSDLYIYFYLLGLRLLQPRGSFCFITSNSWLDVGYGKDLQEFLLKHCRIDMILDNQVKRSFSSADVNTIIALFSTPAEQSSEAILNHQARFVLFKVPFEETLTSDTFKEIEQIEERTSVAAYRVHVIPQQTLLQEGYTGNDDEIDVVPYKTGKPSTALFERRSQYAANKWGGKYLRAPDIYWTILEKGRGKLVRLGDIAEVRRGITTGANEFFYLDEAKIRQWQIEPEYLQPVIKSPRECKSILIDPRDLKFKLFMCHKTKEQLKGTAALRYIQWGESQNYHKRPSCRGRVRWWDLGERNLPLLGFNYLIDTTAKTLYAPDGCYFSDNFQEVIISTDQVKPLCAILNSTLFQLMVNVAGRSNFGGGLLKIQTYEVSDLLCMNPAFVEFNSSELFASTSWDTLQVSRDRRALDAPIFNALDLTQEERDSVYEAVRELVEARSAKASSLKTHRETNKRLEAVNNTMGIWMGVPDEEEEEVDSTYA
jgi:type I restriction-modification system DNA methylase subunit